MNSKETIPSKDQHWIVTINKVNGSEQEKLTGLFYPLGNAVQGIGKLLEENAFMREHYERYASLTNQEKKVLELLATGQQNKAVAEELFISYNTVRTHRNNIHRKLNIRGKGVNHVALYVRYIEAFGNYTQG